MRLALTVLVFLMFAIPGAALAADGPEPLPTRWMAPPGVERLPHDVWESAGPFVVQELSSITTGVKAETGRVAIIVENALYSNTEASITQYQADLANKGYTSVISLVSGGTPEDLRSYLIGLYGEPAGLVGAILVGDLPYIIYELMQDWDGAGGNPPEYEDFPCDIFFMDMDGTWTDDGAGGTVTPGNGKYDGWSNTPHNIEIWVGRMKVDTLPTLGAPADILNTYFLRNHLYRTGQLVPETPPAHGLVYVDDDWGSMVSGDGGDKWCLRQVYGLGNITSVYDEVDPGDNATASDYKTNHMPVDYQLILLRSHGYPGGHGFYQNSRTQFRYVYNSDYRSIDPPALFYSMFVCSGCDYTAQYGSYSDYLGGVAAFNEYHGLLSWGSSKTGGMWNDEAFYSVLGEPNSFGPAFVNWFNETHTLLPDYAPRWWYGMVLIGDPSLIPNGDYFPPDVPADLSAEADLSKIDLTWRTCASADLHHYNIYRGQDRATPSFLASVSAPDTTYPDYDIYIFTTYTYWVTAVDSLDNESDFSDPDTCTYIDPTTVADGGERGLPTILRSQPNPFNPSTGITFSVPSDQVIALRVYDVSGRCVRTLADRAMVRGVHTVYWDGRDEAGSLAASGVYLCRLEREGAAASSLKIVLLK